MDVEISLLVVVASIIARQSGKIDQGGKTHTESSLLLPMLRVRLASSELRAGSKEQDPGSGSGRRVSPDDGGDGQLCMSPVHRPCPPGPTESSTLARGLLSQKVREGKMRKGWASADATTR